MKIVFEVEDAFGDGASINEIIFYNKGNIVNFKTTEYDCFDSVTNGVPVYWNIGIWGRENLNNKKYGYGETESTLLLWKNAILVKKSSWVRFLIELDNNEFDSIRIYVGGQYNRTPKRIRVYNLTDDSKYNKDTHLNNRSDIYLNYIGEISISDNSTSSKYFDLLCDKYLIYQNNHYYTIKQNNDEILIVILNEDNIDINNNTFSSLICINDTIIKSINKYNYNIIKYK